MIIAKHESGPSKLLVRATSAVQLTHQSADLAAATLEALSDSNDFMKAPLQTMLVLVVGAFAATTPSELKVTKNNAFATYESFKRLTKEPHVVAPLTATLCTIPSPALIKAEKNLTGPHHKALIHLYANAEAHAAITNAVKSFLPGSVIVKEKLASDGSAYAVGGMIKRPKGYDSTNGDWEYFYAAKTGAFSTGRLKNCIDCHRQTKTNDYVFSVWDGFK